MSALPWQPSSKKTGYHKAAILPLGDCERRECKQLAEEYRDGDCDAEDIKDQELQDLSSSLGFFFLIGVFENFTDLNSQPL